MQRQILIPLLVVFAAACTSQVSTSSPSEPTPSSAAVPEQKHDAFDLVTRVGADGKTLELGIRAKNGFKINDEYPHSFRPTDSEGLTFAEKRYELWEPGEKKPCDRDVKPVEVCSLDSSIVFDRAAGHAGDVSGVASFSVCNADVCLIERVNVSAKLGS